MSEYILLLLGAASVGLGVVFGYLARQNIARFQVGSIEETLRKRLSEAQQESQKITLEAKKKAVEILDSARKNIEEKEREIGDLQRKLERRQGILDQKIIDLRKREKDFQKDKGRVMELKERMEETLKKKEEELEKISGLSKDKAREELFLEIEKGYKKDLQEKMSKLEKEGEERFERKAKEILASTVQRLAVPSILEHTTTSVSLPDDEIKGRIIGKEGRNIKAFESATGVELIVDETPGVVLLSSFDPLRREVAKIALQELVRDARIQPTRIEETVEKIEKEMGGKK